MFPVSLKFLNTKSRAPPFCNSSPASKQAGENINQSTKPKYGYFEKYSLNI
jgi:hypothetical protein